MRLPVLGSGDAFGNGGRFQTCFALRDDDRAVLIDWGATSLTAMKRADMDPLDVMAVVVSHLHGDHFGGLPFLVLDAQFRRREEPLRVYGPAGIGARLADALEVLDPGSSSVRRRFDLVVTELVPDGTPAAGDGVAVRGYEVDHASGAPPLAVTVRLGGATVGYSGDTAWVPNVLRASAGADIFLVEAYTWDREVKYHLSHRQIADHLDAFEAGRILLTQMSPEVLVRRDQTCAETARDGVVYLP